MGYNRHIQKQKKRALELTGELEVKQGGYAFLRDDNGDIFIPASERNGALNGDSVIVRVTEDRSERHREGTVIKITAMADVISTGTANIIKRRVFITPDDRRIPTLYAGERQRGVEDGVKVVFCVKTRGSEDRDPVCEITEVLGKEGERGVDILCVARTFGLYEEFPPNVAAEAKRKNAPVRPAEKKGREDFTGIPVFTIDGDDSKDFDDALSLEELPDGGYEVGVHIADVSHYVTEGSSLDSEARKRGTSVYLVDKVIPMLPHDLSNGICSLNEGVERLTLSCVLHLDYNACVVGYRIVKGVIRSAHRLTYKNVNRLLSGDPRTGRQYADIRKRLFVLNELAKKLTAERSRQGSIDFEIDESYITVNDAGEVTDVGPRARGDAEKLVEEFMLLANRTVAAEYFYRELPFVYRVHERPTEEKVRALSAFLHGLGIALHTGGEGIKAGELTAVLDKVAGTDTENVVNRVMLRSMQKAVYSPDCGGHFGLGFIHYCHFTSPIRRYPDLMVHRIVSQTIAGTLDIERMDGEVGPVSNSSSERERNAMEAERKVDDIKKCEYMAGHLGEVYDGVVSGVTNGALFVELKNTCEGVIPLSQITDDYYVYDERTLSVRGERSGRRISLGDRMRVQILGVDISAPRITMGLYTGEESDNIK